MTYHILSAVQCLFSMSYVWAKYDMFAAIPMHMSTGGSKKEKHRTQKEMNKYFGTTFGIFKHLHCEYVL